MNNQDFEKIVLAEAIGYTNYRLRKIRGIIAMLEGAVFECHGQAFLTWVGGEQCAFPWEMAREDFRIPHHRMLYECDQWKITRLVQARLLGAVRRAARFLKAAAKAHQEKWVRPVKFAFLTKDVLDFDSDRDLTSRDWICCLQSYFTIYPAE